MADSTGAGASPSFDPGEIFRALTERGVEFVLIGGLAGMAHGSSYPSFDTDIAYRRTDENLRRLADVLTGLGATLRGAPKDLPFTPDATTLRNGMNFTFDTVHGPLDILGEPKGARSWEQLAADAVEAELEGVTVPVASLDDLIAMKQAAGRPKDKLMVAEYVAIAEETRER